jgi:hypothetical protein
MGYVLRMNNESASLVLDHVLIAVGDLDAASERLWREHGLACAAGGHHLDMGTANRLVPLGSAYLELIVVESDADDLPNPYFRDRVRAVRETGPRPFAYVLRGSDDGDFDTTARELGQQPISISRSRPNGSPLTYRMLDMFEALQDATVPGVIEWQPGDNPSHIPVQHAVSAVGIAELEVRCPDAELPSWVHPHPGLPLHPVDADPHGLGRIVVGLEDGGQLVLGDLWSQA